MDTDLRADLELELLELADATMWIEKEFSLGVEHELD